MLNNEAAGSQVALDKAYARIQKLQGINEKLKVEILNHEAKYEAQVQLLKDLNKVRPQSEVVNKENERLVARVKELEGIVAPAK